MSFEVVLCFGKVLDVSLVGSIPALIRSDVVNVSTSACPAYVTRFGT